MNCFNFRTERQNLPYQQTQLLLTAHQSRYLRLCIPLDDGDILLWVFSLRQWAMSKISANSVTVHHRQNSLSWIIYTNLSGNVMSSNSPADKTTTKISQGKISLLICRETKLQVINH